MRSLWGTALQYCDEAPLRLGQLTAAKRPPMELPAKTRCDKQLQPDSDRLKPSAVDAQLNFPSTIRLSAHAPKKTIVATAMLSIPRSSKALH